MTDQRRAAVYARVATMNPGFDTLQHQAGLLLEYADLNDYDVVGVYRDVGSGNRIDRPGLIALMCDADAGMFDVVIMTDPSRLFRKWSLFQEYQVRLRKAGVDVVFADHDSSEGSDL